MKEIKLSKLVVEGFRGILEPTTLDFEKDCKNIVLFGNNGDGKSSFSEAIEWYFTDRIEYLGPEGCTRDDYFNKAFPTNKDASVELSFNLTDLDSAKVLKRQGGKEFSNKELEFEWIITQKIANESIILRHDTMRDFVDKRKTEKLEEVEKTIGFGVVGEIRDVLLKVVNALERDKTLPGLEGELRARTGDISKLIGKRPFEEEEVFVFADEVRKELGHSQPISDLSSLVRIANELEKQTVDTAKGKKLAHLEEIAKHISSLAKAETIYDELKKVVSKQNGMAKRREVIGASVLDKLYKSAAEALEKGWAKSGECPICKTPKDTDTLLEALHQNISEIAVILSERNTHVAYIKESQTLVDNVRKVMDSLTELSKKETEDVIPAPQDRAEINDWLQKIAAWKGLITKMEASPEAITYELPTEGAVKAFTVTALKIKGEIEKQKTSLVETEPEKKFYENIEKLKSLRDDLVKMKELQKQIEAFKQQILSMKKVFTEFERREKAGLSAVLLTISTDVNEFFIYLHPDEKIEEIQLIQPEARGIEFKIRFHGSELSPPRRVLSESHLNSLGICLFLASARHFNKFSGFVVLDDIVSSFDSNHRRTLAKLLRDKFADTQILLLTHDELWFDLMKEDLPQAKWIFKETTKWSYERGVQLIESPTSLKEEIQWLLNRNDADTAANKCRTLIEEILKEKCENLGVRGLECRWGRNNDKREARELMDVLWSYLKENQSLRSQEHKMLFNDLQADQLLTNIGSHHRKLESTTLVRGDIEVTLRDIEEFEQLFICKDCGKEVNKVFSARNAKLKQCRCGHLEI